MGWSTGKIDGKPLNIVGGVFAFHDVPIKNPQERVASQVLQSWIYDDLVLTSRPR